MSTTAPVAVHPIAAPWGRFHLYSFLIDAPELAIVDTGVTESAAQLPAALARLGKDIADVRWILLTHGHIDHVGGAHAIWEATGRRAKIVISAADADFVRSRRAHVAEALKLRGDFVDRGELERSKTREAAAAISGELEPSLLVADGDVLDLGGVAVRVVATPGHTPGAVAYLLEGQRDVFVGDAVQCFGAASGFPGYEDPAAYRASLARLAALAPTRMFLGHPYRDSDGTPLPVALDAAQAQHAFAASLASERRIEAAFEAAFEAAAATAAAMTAPAGAPDEGGSPYAPFAAAASALGYAGDPTPEPAPFFTTMRGYAKAARATQTENTP